MNCLHLILITDTEETVLKNIVSMPKPFRACVWRHFNFWGAKHNCWIAASRTCYQKKRFSERTPRPGVDLHVQKWLEALQKDNNKFDDSNNNGPPLPLTYLPTLNNLVPLPFPLLPPPPQTFKCIHHHYLHPLYCHCRGKYWGPDQRLLKTSQRSFLEK